MGPSTPTASASSRCVPNLGPFSDTSTSHSDNEPPAATNASSNARLSCFAVRATWMPSGSVVGGPMDRS